MQLMVSLLSIDTPAAAPHIVAIALGSNLGDRFANVEAALRLLERPDRRRNDLNADSYLTIVNTSFLYETEPMYVTDQPKFISRTSCLSLLLQLPLLRRPHIGDRSGMCRKTKAVPLQADPFP